MIIIPLHANLYLKLIFKCDPHCIKIHFHCYIHVNFCAELIDIGYEAPAGQMYSSADDLSKLMMLIMNGLDPMDQNNPQSVYYICHCEQFRTVVTCYPNQ